MLDSIRSSSQSWWVRAIFIVLIGIFLSWGVGSALFSTSPNLAVVNGSAITQEQFLQRLEQEKQQIQQQNPAITSVLLEQIGIRQRVYMDLVMQRLLLEEATAVGIFVTDEELATVIRTLPMFQDKDGGFNQTLYAKILEQNRAGVLSFEEDVRKDILVQKLLALVQKTVIVNPSVAESMYMFFNEKRAVEYTVIPTKEFLPSVKVSTQEIQDFYEKNKEMWKQPEQISFSYIPFTIASITPIVQVPKEKIAEYYENHKVTYEGMPKQKAEATIADILKKQMASYAIEEYLDKAQALILEGKSIADVAKELSLPVFSEERRARGEAKINAVTPLFTATVNEIMLEPIPLDTKGEYIIAVVTERFPEGVLPLQEVKDDVRATIVEQKAREKAMEKAKAILLELKKNKAVIPFSATSFFTRREPPKELPIQTKEFIEAVFNTKKGGVVATPYATEQGVLIAKVLDVKYPTRANWKKEQSAFMQEVGAMRAQQAVQAFQQALFSTAKIELLMPALITPNIEG